MSDTELVVAKNISWLHTMKQPKGYAGPVVHYWNNCLNYIGPGMDWRYEGLIRAYLEIFEKTKQKEFLGLAMECGDFLLQSQCGNGAFFNSAFESNPSFCNGSTPHDSAACIGLLALAETLKKQGMQWRKYYYAAEKNFDSFHLGELFIREKGLFAQYRKETAARVPNAFVPNKIATIIELLLEMEKLSGKKIYSKMAIKNAEFITGMHCTELSNGLFQSNDKNKVITLYNARCVPPLLLLYKETSNEKFLESALEVAEFVKRMERAEGGFDFGYIEKGGDWQKCVFPIFVAGGAEMLRALCRAAQHESRLKPSKKSEEFLLHGMLESGGFKTSAGMQLKNTPGKKCGRESWMDVLPVVGWNDKVLRFLAGKLEEKTEIETSLSFDECTAKCADGAYSENEHSIAVTGRTKSYLFRKKAMFGGNCDFFKRIAFNASEFGRGIGLRNAFTAKIARLAKVK